MGFPGNVSDAKSAQLMEIYGFRFVLPSSSPTGALD